MSEPQLEVLPEVSAEQEDIYQLVDNPEPRKVSTPPAESPMILPNDTGKNSRASLEKVE
jgi:hypothetical protein